MIAEERLQLPETVGELFETALQAYAKRFSLYAGLALMMLAVEAVIAFKFPAQNAVLLGTYILLDALLAAIVSIGVLGDLGIAATRPSDAAVASGAIQRWWIVGITEFFLWCIGYSLLSVPTDALTALLLVPVFVLLGTLNFATVIAAVDVKTPQALLAISALGRSMTLSLARPNLSRLVLLALVASLPYFLGLVIDDQLTLRKIILPPLMTGIALDVLSLGPLQAILTVFYLDFTRRAAAQQP